MNVIPDIEIVSEIIISLLVIVIVFISVKIVNFLINRVKKFELDLTLIYLTRDIIHYIIYIIGIIVVFDVFGIDLTSIFISIGIVGVSVGFAAKDIISNFMSGIFIISDKNIKVGDTLKIDNIKGEITKISFRTTIIKDDNGVIITIPNSKLTTTPYLKYRKTEQKKISLNIILPQKIDIEKFKKNILSRINNYPWTLKTPEPNICSIEFTDNGPKLEINFWIKDSTKKDQYKLLITNDVRELLIEGDNE